SLPRDGVLCMSSAALLVEQVLRELEQHLCRLQNRTDLFRGQRTGNPTDGHHALAGGVLRETLLFLRGRGLVGLATRGTFGTQLHVNANKITQLLDGRPTGKREWCRDCGRLLATLLQDLIDQNTDGYPPEALARIGSIRERILRFFFRAIDP